MGVGFCSSWDSNSIDYLVGAGSIGNEIVRICIECHQVEGISRVKQDMEGYYRPLITSRYQACVPFSVDTAYLDIFQSLYFSGQKTELASI